ncbi:MAG: hypothetical protein CMO80_21825 [Verrucomicrobiales bacterium]|nr:hypothetical protein [Verrucomicrobiales bacterium]|tara:strand:- start:2937 stop:3194 length:258 start_codon:yes stop_codon:yes gene_type:complete
MPIADTFGSAGENTSNWYRQNLTGQIDGSKVTFNTEYEWKSNSLFVFINGLMCFSGINLTEGTKQFTLDVVLTSNDTLFVQYIRD